VASWPGSRPPGESSDALVRLTVVVPARQLRELEEQAHADGITVTEAIQRSIELGRIAWRAVGEGQRLLLQDQDGNLKEINFLRDRRR
jgi:hypothetical protein